MVVSRVFSIIARNILKQFDPFERCTIGRPDERQQETGTPAA